ncbi:unnamed protein product [Polarella glacialis]|uniref:C2 domain-containing protein n=1 Tax=Polarella glacialis TaxID=89957 RepID=A0A813GDP4_POLGL|nr:unnamed protein product [Polarella glacialis]CAE8712946.1 unnamed protein product [Polarella glacialis]
METWPVIGAVSLYFASPPRVELQFSGLPSQFPGLAQKVQGAVDGMFASWVLPNFKSFHLTRDERLLSLTEARAQEPIGVLRVQVLRASHLAGANWLMGSVQSFTSDPYCILQLGSSTVRTSTVRGRVGHSSCLNMFKHLILIRK